MKTFAIIPAAGLGKRFGAKKQFLELAGTPVLVHTLRAFEETPSVQVVCVASPETEVEAVRSLATQFGLRKVLKVVPGGKERQDSVRLGFETAGVCDIVVVHDGVRPLVTPEIIQRTIDGAVECGGCIAALPVKETTKRTDPDGFVVDTVDRNGLWSVQTPQAFRHEIFRRAVEQSARDGFLGTDEAMLVERIGAKVKVVTGSPYNIKITTPEDLAIAEAFLKLR
ncbi:MAG TPA: 2-C-methyl-D-erythritol 4-phosphate cytidylyltransferase [bacterium]|nr:2-C-methyl-D-erythritol 4-phosphate cytidylyltransferase [bacterium]